MKLYDLVTVPTYESLQYLQGLFKGCPFDVNLRQCYVSLNISESPSEPDHERTFLANCGAMGIYYDSTLQSSSLVLPLYSEEMVERAAELRESELNKFYGDLYFPHMVIVPYFPPSRRHFNAFVNSVADALIGAPLNFGGEVIKERELSRAPASEFYQEMALGYANGPAG